MKIALLTLALCLIPLAAAAEVEPSCPEGQQDCTIYSFGNERVTGETESGELDRTGTHRPRGNEPLVRVRTDFFPELFKSVEQI